MWNCVIVSKGAPHFLWVWVVEWVGHEGAKKPKQTRKQKKSSNWFIFFKKKKKKKDEIKDQHSFDSTNFYFLFIIFVCFVYLHENNTAHANEWNRKKIVQLLKNNKTKKVPLIRFCFCLLCVFFNWHSNTHGNITQTIKKT